MEEEWMARGYIFHEKNSLPPIQMATIEAIESTRRDGRTRSLPLVGLNIVGRDFFSHRGELHLLAQHIGSEEG